MEFTPDELRMSERMLQAAAALGITAMAASGDLGFLGCDSDSSGANFPASSRWVTGVGWAVPSRSARPVPPARP